MFRRILVGLLLVGAQAFAANIVVNGSFENPVISDPRGWAFVSGVPGWTTNDSIGEIWRGYQGAAAAGQQHYEVDVEGKVDRLSQTLATVPGADYVLTFALKARLGVEDNRVNVLWNDNLLGTVNTFNPNSWTYFSFLARAAGSSTVLAFQEGGPNDGQGGLLDDVSVETHMPEPSTVLLMGAGAVVLGLLRRRQRPSVTK